MNKKFIAEVLKLAPELSVVDYYFYEEPVDHILCGFVAERPPSGAYFWKYAFPLYDRFKFLHLTFGNRLPPPDGYMTAGLANVKAVAAEFVRRIQPYRSEVASLAQLDRFAEYIETEIGLGNDIVRRGYALTLILLGRADEAASELRTLNSIYEEYRDHPVYGDRYTQPSRDAKKLLSDLSVGIEVAQETLEGWEQETKRRLGL